MKSDPEVVVVVPVVPCDPDSATIHVSPEDAFGLYWDKLWYGNAYVRKTDDGRYERIPGMHCWPA